MKRKAWIFGGLSTLLLAGIVVVIVLAALGYFSKKSGGSPVTPPTPSNPNTPASLPQPGNVIISNLTVDQGPTGKVPTGVTYDISEPCGINYAGSDCSSTLNILYTYSDGTREERTKDITGYWIDTINFSTYGSVRVPTQLTLSAYNTVYGINGPTSSPITINTF